MTPSKEREPMMIVARRLRRRAIAMATTVAIAALTIAAGGDVTQTRRTADTTSRRASAPMIFGTYVVKRVNARTLPYSDRLPASDGWEHRATLERAFLHLEPGGTFSLYIRYRQTHQPRGTPTEYSPLLDADLHGRWALEGTTLTMAPDPPKRGRTPETVVAQIQGGRVILPYRYSTGWASRRYVMEAQYDPSYY
jgi:hypothetical protein